MKQLHFNNQTKQELLAQARARAQALAEEGRRLPPRDLSRRPVVDSFNGHHLCELCDDYFLDDHAADYWGRHPLHPRRDWDEAWAKLYGSAQEGRRRHRLQR